MSSKLAITLFVAIFFTTGCGNTVAASKNTKAGQGADQLKTSYSWHDGTRAYTIWLDPELIAEIKPSGSGKSAVRGVLPGAAEVQSPQALVRLWRVSGVAINKTILDNVRSADPATGFAQVFHDSPSRSGRKRVPIGNVIVTLPPLWGDDQIRGWARDQGLVILKKLTFGNNIVLIKSQPGLASIDLANKLHNSAQVVSASPDWWTEVATR